MTFGDAIAGLMLLLTGALGWKAISEYFLRPRLFKAHRSQNLVTLTDPKRREHIEGILRQQGEPSALIEIEWWNSGRKASGTTQVVVTVPGSTVGEVEVVENAEAKTTPPVQLKHQGADMVEATKSSLNPSARCRIVVGYAPDKPYKVDQVAVLMHEGGRAVPNSRPPGTVSNWIGYSILAVCWFIPFFASLSLQSLGRLWLAKLVGYAGPFGLAFIALFFVNRLARARGGPSWAQPSKES